MDKEMLSELDRLEKENLSDKAKTEYYKKKFIEELKLGLGEEKKRHQLQTKKYPRHCFLPLLLERKKC